MPTSRTPLRFLRLGLASLIALPAGGAGALDLSTVQVSPAPEVSPAESFRAGTRAYFSGDKTLAFRSLRAAADRGHAVAQWKLGRMYAEGDGVPADPLKAFELFSRIADAHADDGSDAHEARFVSNAFVALGSYYLEGIPGSQVRPDARRAVDLFTYAASYFGDPDAQYELGRIYAAESLPERNPRQSARWFGLAARKGHRGARAMLGDILFRGKGVDRRPAEGLMWLELAAAEASAARDAWIRKLHQQALSEAAAGDRDKAAALVERHRKKTVRGDASPSSTALAAPR